MATDNRIVSSMEELGEKEREALAKSNDYYSGQISQIESKYDEMIKATEAAGEEAKRQQQAQSDFAISQIEQQQEQTQKDYEKEQSAAYADYTKQTQKHGTAAEQIAAGGMWGSGYSESAQTAMYTAYQNRIATARASMEQAKVSYDNAMTQARLTNDAALAEIALQTLQNTLAYEMESLLQTQALQAAMWEQKQAIQSAYSTQRSSLMEQNKYTLTELIKTGYTPSAEEMEAAGMSQTEVDSMAGYFIGDGDGVLTEEELLGDKSRYNMDGLGDFGKGLTEEELEELIKAGIVQVTADTQKGVVSFAVADMKAARNYLEVIKPQMEKLEKSGASASGSSGRSDSTGGEIVPYARMKAEAETAREKADAARKALTNKMKSAGAAEDFTALRAEELEVEKLEKEAANKEELYNYYRENTDFMTYYTESKQEYEAAKKAEEKAWAEYEKLTVSEKAGSRGKEALKKAQLLRLETEKAYERFVYYQKEGGIL